MLIYVNICLASKQVQVPEFTKMAFPSTALDHVHRSW